MDEAANVVQEPGHRSSRGPNEAGRGGVSLPVDVSHHTQHGIVPSP
jgi:hypothetical protein